MSQEQIFKTLVGLGLTRLDSEVYIFLSKKGPLLGAEIIQGLKIQKQPLYRSLKNLQSKGIVASTLERPARFTAVSFDKVVDIFVKTKMVEAQRMQENKNEILAHWKAISVGESADASAKFNLIEGRGPIYAKILQMMQETQNQLSTMFTVTSLIRADQLGLFDGEIASQIKPTIRFRVLTELNEQNLNLTKKLIGEITKSKFIFEGRALNADLTLPQLFIRDEEEILFFAKPRVNDSSAVQDDICLWTNCKSFVQAFTTFFEDFWRNSTEIVARIAEIETGTPSPKTFDAKDTQTTQKNWEVRNLDEKENTIAASSKSVATSKKSKLLSKKTLAIIAAVLVIATVGLAFVAALQPGTLFLPYSPPTSSPSIAPTNSSNPSVAPSGINTFPSNSNGTFSSPLSATDSPQIASTSPNSTSPVGISMTSVFFDSPTISADGTKISVPFSFVNESKIVNLDLRLRTPVASLCFGGRNITLSAYRSGNFLPLIIIITPRQNLLAAIRVCEPCHTFNFNIIDGMLQCDSPCRTQWNIETLQGISGMCMRWSPPEVLASVVGDKIIVDISQLQIQVTP